MKITPKVPKKIPLLEAALKTGKYQVCPDVSFAHPRIIEPMQNPDRNNQVVHWVPEQFSYQMPDGGTFFCDLLQNGDPKTAWDTTQADELTEEDF